MRCFINGEKVRARVIRYFRGDMKRLIEYHGKEYMVSYRDGRWQEVVMLPRPIPPQGGAGVIKCDYNLAVKELVDELKAAKASVDKVGNCLAEFFDAWNRRA